jgi:hypothetical protein
MHLRDQFSHFLDAGRDTIMRVSRLLVAALATAITVISPLVFPARPMAQTRRCANRIATFRPPMQCNTKARFFQRELGWSHDIWA